MRSLKPYPLDSQTLASLQSQITSGIPLADIVAPLRAAGLDKVNSIKFLAEFGGLRLGQANDIVHLSPTWADRYASDEAFQDAVENAFELIAIEDRTAA